MRAPSSSGEGRGKLARLRGPLLVAALWLAIVTGATAAISLSQAEARKVGRKIWQNECGGTIAGLTSWNAGEKFASLGIGHFIWYPQGESGPFAESFPPLLAYMRKRGAALPALLRSPNNGCPWKTRADFLAATSSAEMKTLRAFLADTVDLQADFLVLRLREALPKMLAAAPAAKRAAIENNFNRVAGSAQGCYALIDYVNFKGEGTLTTERYAGRGWGLLQALEGMSGEASATVAFADSAAQVLRARVKNSPPSRHEARWLPGWLNRVATYR